MRYLFIAFLFVSLFGHSQGIEPSSFQGNPNKSGFLKSVTLNVDDFGDTTYLYVHVDSLGIADSIYLRGDSLILLKNGSGQVYKNRIYTGLFSAYDVANPQKYDIYVNADQTSYWWDGTDWVLFDGDTNPYNEGKLTLHDMDTNVVGMRSNTNYFNVKNFVGLNGIQLTTNELDSLNIGIDTTLFAGETQYLNPYVITGDTVGFYLTIAQDTVLFLSTLDSTGVADSTSVVGGYGIDVVESPANTFTVEVDTSQVATPHDLTSKVEGSGVATRVAFWDGAKSLSSNSNLFWDNVENELEIKNIPIGSRSTAQIYMGINAANGATNASASNFFGINAGAYATNANGSNFFGGESGYYASGASISNFFGNNAGAYATNASNSNFFGYFSGRYATNAYYSNFFGAESGVNATNAVFSNFFGNNAGTNATNASNSNFFGNNAGNGCASSSFSNFFGFNTGSSDLGANNIIIGKALTLPSGYSNSINIGAILFGTGAYNGESKISESNTGGKIGVLTNTPQRTIHIEGEARITDLTTDTPTKIVGSDGDGDLADIKLGNGVILNNDTLKVDSSKFATMYDLTQVSGSSSKTIDILGSDFTTSATSLQTTDLAYTFPSTGTYEVKLYGQYTSSNTANGILCAYVESGGLTASFVTGSHYVYDRSTSASGSTMAIRGVSALGHVIATSSVVTANSPLTIMSEILVTVSATGTLTFNFASESGSYSATLVAGSSLIIEKLD